MPSSCNSYSHQRIIKVSDLTTLIQEDLIAIDRSKRGPSNHKAFITKEVKKIIQDRKKDFELIFLMKELDAYLFTSESYHFKKLRREAITRDVNKVMRLVSKQLPHNTLIGQSNWIFCVQNYNVVRIVLRLPIINRATTKFQNCQTARLQRIF